MKMGFQSENLFRKMPHNGAEHARFALAGCALGKSELGIFGNHPPAGGPPLAG